MPDRRFRKRVPLRCPVEVRAKRRRYSGHTVNISSTGIYCILDTPLPMQEKVDCYLALEFRPWVPEPQKQGVVFKCDCVVIRTEEVGGMYGVACRIDGYRILKPSEANAVHAN